MRLRKRIKLQVSKISIKSVKFQQEINDDVQTWFEKSYASRIKIPVQNGLMQKVNIFYTGNDHLHAFYAPIKNGTNWMRATF